jgi:hypothetical protein
LTVIEAVAYVAAWVARFTDAVCVTVWLFETESGEREAVTAAPLARVVALLASADEAVTAATSAAERASVSRRARESDPRMGGTPWRGDWAIPQSIELRDIAG